jgi:hypothetical protein
MSPKCTAIQSPLLSVLFCYGESALVLKMSQFNSMHVFKMLLYHNSIAVIRSAWNGLAK